ncbi:MAG: hypothetical protein PWR27_86 [Petroclostridium sp.]|nr:hypothetical protein [Petroclostridium sp.]
MRVTINDIAKAANVSPSTVSRAIANNPRISKKTRQKIFQIMKEMNYHPNLIARSLVNRSTRIIGLVVPGNTEKAFQHPFFPEILRGIASVAHKYKYNILISSVTNVRDEKQMINELVKGGVVEGVVLMTSKVKDPSIAELVKTEFPFVVVGRPVNDDGINWVDNNNFAIGYELTQHFIKQGHKKIAFIGVSQDLVATLDRLEGYKKALQDSNLPVDDSLIIESNYLDDNGYDLVQKIDFSQKKPTGIIACDDFLAFGIIKFLNEHGFKVPEDVAVAGINNVALSEHSVPPLTSVEINAFQLGVKAFELLFESIKSDFKSINRAIIPAKLIIRESTSVHI